MSFFDLKKWLLSQSWIGTWELLCLDSFLAASRTKHPCIGLNPTYSIVTTEALTQYRTVLYYYPKSVIQNDLFPCLSEQSSNCGIWIQERWKLLIFVACFFLCKYAQCSLLCSLIHCINSFTMASSSPILASPSRSQRHPSKIPPDLHSSKPHETLRQSLPPWLVAQAPFLHVQTRLVPFALF